MLSQCAMNNFEIELQKYVYNELSNRQYAYLTFACRVAATVSDDRSKFDLIKKSSSIKTLESW